MLRIRVEVHPFGDSRQAYAIEVVDVGNVGTVDAAEATDPGGERAYAVYRRHPHDFNGPPEGDPDATVVHRRADGALRLAQRALNALLD